jgi:hypothetical protein
MGIAVERVASTFLPSSSIGNDRSPSNPRVLALPEVVARRVGPGASRAGFAARTCVHSWKLWLDNRLLPAQCTGSRPIFAKRSGLTQLSRTYGRALRHWHAMSGYAGSRPLRRTRPRTAAWKSVLIKCEEACGDRVVGPDVLIAEIIRSVSTRPESLRRPNSIKYNAEVSKTDRSEA